MEHQEKLEQAGQLIQFLNNQKQMKADDKQQLKLVYGEVFGQYNINVHCSDCVIHYLNYLADWYHQYFKPSAVEPAPQINKTKNKKSKQ